MYTNGETIVLHNRDINNIFFELAHPPKPKKTKKRELSSPIRSKSTTVKRSRMNTSKSIVAGSKKQTKSKRNL